MIKLKEIRSHEMLDDEQRLIATALVKIAKRDKSDFTWLAFAEVALRASAKTYAAAAELGEAPPVQEDRELRRAAVLYVFEALRACDLAIIKEWPEFDEMLKNLEYLMGDLP